MYRIDGRSTDAEIGGAVNVIHELTERMRRLAEAYGQWQTFDAGAYFDLTGGQAAMLLYLRERVATVHLRVAVDLLLPSVQSAVRFWGERYAPALINLRRAVAEGAPIEAQGDRLQRDLQTHMTACWAQATHVATEVRRALANDIAYLSMRGAEEERTRWQRYWRQGAALPTFEERLPQLARIPTLTLIFDFPLPPARQSGRLRRLRRNRHRARRNLRN